MTCCSGGCMRTPPTPLDQNTIVLLNVQPTGIMDHNTIVLFFAVTFSRMDLFKTYTTVHREGGNIQIQSTKSRYENEVLRTLGRLDSIANRPCGLEIVI
jgi:hypothetical protein